MQNKGRQYVIGTVKLVNGVTLAVIILLDTNEVYNLITGEYVDHDRLMYNEVTPIDGVVATITGYPMTRIGTEKYQISTSSIS